VVAGQLGATEPELPDLAGDRVRLSPSSRLALDFVFPTQVRLTLPRDRFATAEAARAAIARAGLSSPTSAALPVTLPTGSDHYLFYGRPRAELREPVELNLKGLSPDVKVE